jgi:hypothetical protein
MSIPLHSVITYVYNIGSHCLYMAFTTAHPWEHINVGGRFHFLID